MYSLFLPQGFEIKLIFALRASIFEIRANFQNFRIWAWNLEYKGPKVAYVLSFHPKKSRLSLFLLYGQSFLRYGPIFKIPLFGHEIWNLKKGPKVAYVLSFYPKGAEIKLIFALRSRFRDRASLSLN